MSKESMTALKEEATSLGLSFSPNIGEAKLQEKVDAHYTAVEKPVAATLQESPAPAKTEEWTDADRRKLAAKRERDARKTVVVKIIDNDQRVNNKTTCCTVNCSNAMFDLGTRILPLDVPVEVMEGHLEQLRELEIPQHVDTKDGRGETKMRKRYTISYEQTQPQ